MKIKLNKSDWLEHGFVTLAASGHSALRADTMAKALGVSRGSFYWHFRDVETFYEELLELWRERMTEQVIRAIDKKEKDVRLSSLMLRSMGTVGEIEQAMRAWAMVDRRVASALSAVDALRLGYLQQLLQATGIKKRTAATRATIIYWAYLGRLMVSSGEISNMDAKALEEIAELFQMAD